MSEALTIYRLKRTREFWSHVSKDADGCWRWTATLNNKGYGTFFWRGQRKLVHRLIWIIINGAIPDGLCVLHHCDHPPCVRLNHLFLGTKKDNSQDMVQKGRARGPNTDKAICKNGHSLAGDNIRPVAGGRRCWPCFLDWQRQYRAKHKRVA